MATDYISRSDLRGAVASLLPPLKDYIDNKEPDLTAITRRIECIEALAVNGDPAVAATLSALDGLIKDGRVPYSARGVEHIPPCASVTARNSAFEGCASLTAVPAVTFDSGDLNYAFSGCTALESLPATLWEARPTSVYVMFKGCESLTTLADMPEDFFSEVTGSNGLQSTFEGCTRLEYVPRINAPKNSNLQSTFANCKALRTIEGIDASALTCIWRPVTGCTALNTLRIHGIGTHPDLGCSDQLNVGNNTWTPVLFGPCGWGSGDSDGLDSLHETFTTLLFDRVAAGYAEPCYIFLRPDLLGRLTAREPGIIAAMQEKGYTVVATNVECLISADTREPCNWSCEVRTDHESFTIHRAVNDPMKDRPWPPVEQS